MKRAVDSAVTAGGCGQLVDGLALRARRYASTADHHLTTAPLDNSAASGLRVDHSHLDNPPLRYGLTTLTTAPSSTRRIDRNRNARLRRAQVGTTNCRRWVKVIDAGQHSL